MKSWLPVFQFLVRIVFKEVRKAFFGYVAPEDEPTEIYIEPSQEQYTGEGKS